jgi:ketosteroid isomerase-like protein
MTERTLASNADLDELREADAIAALLELNSQYVRAFVESDVEWYDEHLSDEFVCTLADGRRIDKTRFLQRNAHGPGVSDVSFDVLDVVVLGEVALVQGVTHYIREGARESTSYTDVWRRHGSRWRAIAAQLTAVDKR